MGLPNFLSAAYSVPGSFLPCVVTTSKAPAKRRKSPDDPETDRAFHKAWTNAVPVRRSRLGRCVIEGSSAKHAPERGFDRRRPEPIGGGMLHGAFGIAWIRIVRRVGLAVVTPLPHVSQDVKQPELIGQ